LGCCHVAGSCTVISLAAIGRVEGQQAGEGEKRYFQEKGQSIIFSVNKLLKSPRKPEGPEMHVIYNDNVNLSGENIFAGEL